MSMTTANGTADLIKKVLDGLGYSGTWKISFSQHLRQKSSAKFKFIRRDGNVLRMRTKPGSNDTCWDIVLQPPQGVLSQDVSKDLRQVHPTKLIIPSPSRVPLSSQGPMKPVEFFKDVDVCGFGGGRCNNPVVEQVRLPDGVRSVCSKHMTSPEWLAIIQTAKSFEKLEKELNAVKKEKVEERKEKVEVEENKESKFPVPKLKKTNGFSLVLDPSLEDLRYNATALVHGLVAVMLASDEDGYADLGLLTGNLRGRLHLEDYLNQSNYTSLVGITREITRGLVEKGYIERVSNSLPSSKRISTKGYKLTNRGRKKLRNWLSVIFESGTTNSEDNLIVELQESADRIKLFDVAKDTQPVAQTPKDTKPITTKYSARDDTPKDTPTVAKDSRITEKLEQNFETTSKLINELEQLISTIKGIPSVIEDLRKKFERFDSDVLEKKNQINKLQEEIAKIGTDRIEVEKEIEMWEGELSAGPEKIEDLKRQIRKTLE